MRSLVIRTDGLLVPAAITLGCLALAARPASLAAIAVISVLVGTAGVMGPVSSGEPLRAARSRWALSVLIGVLACATARAFGPRTLSTPVASVLVAVALASLAEEAFFRRLVYGWLAGWGPIGAVAGAAALFAAVHVPAYGASTVPLNVAAGVLFGWQRWATGGWSAPALTHLAANFIMVG